MSWICKNCETENPDAMEVCEVCSSTKPVFLFTEETIYGDIREYYSIDNVEYHTLGYYTGGDALSRVPANYSKNIFEIPNFVSEIGSDAFKGCFMLREIVIPNSVKAIGDSAFYDCTNLEQLTIPESVCSIDADPDTASSAGSWPFWGCSSLQTISVSPNNKVYDSRNNCHAIIKTSDNKLVLGCCNTIIPDSVYSIGSRAFRDCASLKRLAIPKSVVVIEAEAFTGCISLEEITLPTSLKWIYCDAFSSCSSLKQIKIPQSVRCIGANLFFGCNLLQTIYIHPKLDENVLIQLRGELAPKLQFKYYVD